MIGDIPQHLQLFADQAKDIAIVFLDAAGDIEWFSQGAERLFGYTADEMVGQPIARLFTRMRGLGTHLGPVLYQLPPGWRVDRERFGHFLAALPRGARHVVEFREPSWYDAEIRRLMERYRVSLCLHDMPGSATGRDDEGRTGAFVYVRFHGATSKYGGGYPETRLRGWADWLNARRGEGCDVYAYFNNDVGGHAPRDALTLRRALEES